MLSSSQPEFATSQECKSVTSWLLKALIWTTAWIRQL